MKINLNRLKIAMAKNCLTAVELSKKSSVSRGTLTNIMNNKTETSLATIGKLAKALEVDVTEIIVDEAAATAKENNQGSRDN